MAQLVKDKLGSIERHERHPKEVNKAKAGAFLHSLAPAGIASRSTKSVV